MKRLILALLIVTAFVVGATFGQSAAATRAFAAGDSAGRLDGTSLAATVAQSATVAYRTVPGDDGEPVSLLADVYTPGDPGVHPVVIVWHPGGFVMGDRKEASTVRAARALAARGYVAVAADYRLRTDWRFSLADEEGLAIAQRNAHDDARALLAFLRANGGRFGVDPDRIAEIGFSAGGMLSLASSHDGLRAVVSISGCVVGDTMLDEFSAPVLMLHGTADPVLPVEQCAYAAHDAALAAGAPVDLVTGPGGHMVSDSWADWLDRVSAFLDQHMRAA